MGLVFAFGMGGACWLLAKAETLKTDENCCGSGFLRESVSNMLFFARLLTPDYNTRLAIICSRKVSRIELVSDPSESDVESAY